MTGSSRDCLYLQSGDEDFTRVISTPMLMLFDVRDGHPCHSEASRKCKGFRTLALRKTFHPVDGQLAFFSVGVPGCPSFRVITGALVRPIRTFLTTPRIGLLLSRMATGFCVGVGVSRSRILISPEFLMLGSEP